MQNQRHSFGQPMQQQGDATPVAVQAALVPPLTERNRSQPVGGEFMASSVACDEQTVAAYAKWLVEVACPELWLLLICQHANPKTGVVKLCYGAGYETTVVIGDANANGKPKKIAVGLAVNSREATVEEIGSLWISGSDSIWNQVSSARGAQGGGRVCVYVLTGRRKFMIPPLSDEELESRQRMLRVWPDPEDANCIERMELLDSNAPPPAAAKKKKGKDSKSKSETKNTYSSTDENSSDDEEETPAAAASAPENPRAKKKKGKGVKKRSSSMDEKADESTEPKKKRAKRDPTKPKLASTVYGLYMQDHRPRIREENPSVSFGEVTKILARDYKNLTEEEKNEYQPRVDADRKRYKEEMEVWKEKKESEIAEKEASDDSTEAGSSDDEEETAKPAASTKKKAKDSTKPSGKKNAYTIYVQENRDEYEKAHPDADWPTVRDALGEAYHALDEKSKEKYTAMAEEDKDRYSKAMEVWKEGKDDDDSPPTEKKKRKKKDPNAPKKAASAYILFSTDHRPAIKEANPEASFGEIGKLLGQAWKEASKEDVEKYNGMAAKEKERYAREMEVYKGQTQNENAKADEASTDSDDSDSDKKPAAKPAPSAKAPSSPKAKKTAAAAEESPASPKAKPSAKKSTPKKKAPAKEDEATSPAEEDAESPSKKRKHSEEEVETAPVASSTTKKKKKKRKKARKKSLPLTK